VSAYRQITDTKALRAYHLHRVTSKFKTTISKEGARRLSWLLVPQQDMPDTP
jgi:hypothetical protein